MYVQPHLCVDDYGNAVFECRYTGHLVWPDDGVVIGATIPGVKARYVMMNSTEARLAKKESGIAFHEFEANCNTCKHLQRVKHEKDRAGFVYGKCLNETKHKNDHPYLSREVDGVMMFHPDDPMHMKCYESRWSR